MKCCRDEVSQEKIRILGLVIKRSPLILRRTVSIESVLESDKWKISEKLEVERKCRHLILSVNKSAYLSAIIVPLTPAIQFLLVLLSFRTKGSHRLLEDRSRTYSNLPSHMSQSTDFLSPSKCTLENLRVRATSVSLLLIWKCRRKKKFSNLNKCQITSATGSNFFFLSIFLSCKWKLRAMTVFYMLCQGIANTGC